MNKGMPGGSLERSNSAESPGKSVIVAAHPDDEILWFSSVLMDVDEIIICYLDVESRPVWSRGRRDSLSAYPLPNVSCLGITESEVFDCANWAAPVATEYGLEVSKKRGSIARYRENFIALRDALGERLKDCATVYSHNPWGEYGHEEHVQVYRALRSLQGRLPFRLWYTNYFSNKSVHYMNRFLVDSPLVSYPLPTDPEMAAKLMELYKRYKCWTWYNDYVWPDEERFILDEASGEEERFGRTLALNYINLQPYRPGQRPGPAARIRRAMTRAGRRLGWKST